ncbi:putative dynamin-related protein 4A [Platanthera guangdongensis]|uniref:Dynamin-related protein 4A n=1 Tax=Platanthera guangdongensis TaxID=2320717 RepID=A0ABR2N516_9ASPA
MFHKHGVPELIIIDFPECPLVPADGENTRRCSSSPKPMTNPLISSYTECIRPLLNAVNGPRQQNILEEEVKLLTIFVVDDQSSCKASVIESLASINLPQGGTGWSSEMPVQCGLYLQYGGNQMGILSKESIEDAIQAVTNQIADNGKNYSDTPLTLMFHKHDVSQLTIIDLTECPLAPAAGELLLLQQCNELYTTIQLHFT